MDDAEQMQRRLVESIREDMGESIEEDPTTDELPRHRQDLADLYMEHRQERGFEKHPFETLLGDRLPPTIEEEGEVEEEEEEEEEEEGEMEEQQREHQLESLLKERLSPTIEEKDEDEEKEKEEEEMREQQEKHQFETLPPTKVTIEEEGEGGEEE